MGSPKDDRPSQDQLRSLFNDYLTGKRKATPSAPPERPPRKPKPQAIRKPSPPPKPVEVLPPNLNPKQLGRLKGLKGTLPPAAYRRLLALPELAKDAGAFFSRWDRLVNGFGLKGAAGVLLGDAKPEDACVTRLSQLLRCDPKQAGELARLERFATLPPERRALSIRDRVTQLAKRWDCPPESAAAVLAGKATEAEVAERTLARKLRVDAGVARLLLSGEPPGEPAAVALALAARLQQGAMAARVALSEVVQARLAELKAERELSGAVAAELQVPEELAARLCARAGVRELAALERGKRTVAEVRHAASELGCAAAEAARWVAGELAAGELDAIVGRKLASSLGVEAGLGLELARHPEHAAVPPLERAKKAEKAARALAQALGCGAAEAAGLLAGTIPPAALAAMLRARLGTSEEPAAALAVWVRAQPGALGDAALGALDRVAELKKDAGCTLDQAALLLSGRLTPEGLRAERLAEELRVAPELAAKVIAYIDAEKLPEAEAKVRLRNLRSWAADTMELACRMLIKEVPTPTKSDSDAIPFSGAWE